MRKNILPLLTLCAAMLSIVIAGCGSSGSSSPPSASQASKSTVFGVVSRDSTANGTVSVKDASVPAQEKTAAINGNGTYTVDVSGLKSPFLLKAVWTDREGSKRIYSASAKGGRTNINPLSDAAVTAAADGRDRDELYARRNHDDDDRTAGKFGEVLSSLRTVLAPLFTLYQTSVNAVSGDDEGEDDGDDDGDDDNDNAGLHAMFRDVRFEVKDGVLTVTNRQTGGVIFSGPLDDLASGTFYPENMPGAPGTGDVGTTTPPPAACIYTYGPWGACLSNTQTRNLLSSSPAGCTGTPVLSQPCATDVPPAPACGSCHAIPPATGQHSFHVTSMGFSCDRCHGTGYSSTSVNAATHNNGVKDVVSSLNFNATTRSCSPGCHGTRSW